MSAISSNFRLRSSTLLHARTSTQVQRALVRTPQGPRFTKPRKGCLPVKATATVENSVTMQLDKGRKRLIKEEALLLQGFGWDSCRVKNWYEVVKHKVHEIKEGDITHVWLPPPSQSVSAQGYMPGQLYNLTSCYGNEKELKDLITALKHQGVVPIADIVINHRCADEMVDGVWNKFRDDVDHKGRKIDWGKWAITGNDPVFGGQGNPDTGDDYGPAPDLDHANPELRAALKDWLEWLHEDIGFDGWRLDFVKGYGANFVEEYICASVGKKALNVGEFWTDLKWEGSCLAHNQDAARQRLCDWIDGNKATCLAFDFPTKGILQEACRHTEYSRLRDCSGKAPGLIGWWPAMAVTFVDNHDTGSSQQHWPFPADYVATGYAYILTHPGVPCIFWEHYFDWGSKLRKDIQELSDIRHRNHIKADSRLEILAADNDMYVARIDNRVMLKLGPRYDIGGLLPKASDGWKMAHSGKDFAVWEKC